VRWGWFEVVPGFPQAVDGYWKEIADTVVESLLNCDRTMLHIFCLVLWPR
jgi:hypothetical protein